jgi:hypothetical protein
MGSARKRFSPTTPQRSERAGEVKILAGTFTAFTRREENDSHSDTAPFRRLVVGGQSVELVSSSDSR